MSTTIRTYNQNIQSYFFATQSTVVNIRPQSQPPFHTTSDAVMKKCFVGGWAIIQKHGVSEGTMTFLKQNDNRNEREEIKREDMKRKGYMWNRP